MSDDQTICANCKWWTINTKNVADERRHGAFGYCRFNPPVMGDHDCDRWPCTVGDEWCGRFEYRDHRAARLLRTKYMTKGEAA